MLSANIIFSCCTFALKLIPADVFDIMIVRFTMQSVVFGVFAAFYKGYNVFGTNGQPIASALNIFMSSLTNFMYFAALYFLPLSDLNTIKHTHIVWAAILAVIFLKDRFKVVNGVTLCLTCIGLMLATKPHFFMKTLSHIFNPSSSATVLNTTTTTTIATAATTSSYYYLGVTLASVSALTKSILLIARKQLVKTKQPHTVMNFQFAVAGLFVSTVYSIIRRFWQPGPYPWKWMGTAGVIIGSIQLLTNTLALKALKRTNVQLVTVVGSLDILYAVVLQYIFFHQTKSWIFFTGASLIVLSALILSVDRHLANKREKKSQASNENNHHNDV